MTLSAERLRQLALKAGFDLVGFAPVEPIPSEVLEPWLQEGYHADLTWMQERASVLLDVTQLLPGAKTVVALACNYWWSDEPSPVARYARGRDYHATMRDRLRALRRSVRTEFPSVNDYGSVDSSGVMEKVWAVRAGLGVVTKNGLLTTPEFGSWVVLAAMLLDAPVDTYAALVADDPCGRCRICIDACPTGAIVADRTINAKACLSYQTIENTGAVPEALRPGFEHTIFGCDICQETCPLNMTPLKAGMRFEPRPLAKLTRQQMAALGPGAYESFALGSPLARAGYDGLRRNAALALGAAREQDALTVLEKLTTDSSDLVREAAQWAVEQLTKKT